MRVDKGGTSTPQFFATSLVERCGNNDRRSVKRRSVRRFDD